MQSATLQAVAVGTAEARDKCRYNMCTLSVRLSPGEEKKDSWDRWSQGFRYALKQSRFYAAKVLAGQVLMRQNSSMHLLDWAWAVPNNVLLSRNKCERSIAS